MKPHLTILTALFLGLITACSSDSEDDLIPIMEPDPVTPEQTTYSANIQPIMNSSCVQCHSNPPTNGAPNSLTTYDLVRASAENGNLIQRMNSENAPMPPTSGLLPKPTRDQVQKWKDDGFPE